ncbi:MAG: TetR/AcrR family transcriptional regulator [Planctomycetota bacterium]
MARRNVSEERRRELIRAVAMTFADLGYRRTTTAALAERCGVQETILYRLWPDKRAMFLAAIDFVAEHSDAVWRRVRAAGSASGSPTMRVLEHESEHLGEFGFYRILFAGLSETDDPEIAAAMRSAYQRFLTFIVDAVDEHRKRGKASGLPPADLTAWALLGLGTAANIGRELRLLPAASRKRLLATIGRHLLG